MHSLSFTYMIPVPLFFLSFFPGVCFSAEISLDKPLADQGPFLARAGKPYSVTLSNETFSSEDELVFSCNSPREWLHFEPTNRTFYGTPPNNTDDSFSVVVTAHSRTDSATSKAVFKVTSTQPPSLNKPISDQFTAQQSALYSIYPLSKNSALASGSTSQYPALRVSNGWSFSIGFLADTFVPGGDDGSVNYEVLQANGETCPDWMQYKKGEYSLDGVAPKKLPTDPYKLSLQLVASDPDGLMKESQPFDLYVASHELSSRTLDLPTLNITAGQHFRTALISPNDFAGVQVNGRPIQVSDVESFDLDTSNRTWLQYDRESMTLSGTPDNVATTTKTVLPAILRTNFNQSLEMTFSLSVVPSFFKSANLTLEVEPGQRIHYDLSQNYSNSTSMAGDSISITPAYSCNSVRTDDAGLTFDTNSGLLSGFLDEKCRSTGVTVTFTAYSRITHSTSHSVLIITPTLAGRKASSLSGPAHARLVLGVIIAFSAVGGLLLLVCFLAWFRRYARVKDTAVEGGQTWSEQDKRWYGVSLERLYGGSQDLGYGWTEGHSGQEKSRTDTEAGPTPSPEVRRGASVTRGMNYGHLGLGLRGGSERRRSLSPLNKMSPKAKNQPAMTKGEFMSKIRQTMRRVSDKATSLGRRNGRRPAIGKPQAILRVVPDGLPVDYGANPFEGPGLDSNPGSTIMTNSPSTSTGERSIPRRRPDFGPPAPPGHVHFKDHLLPKPDRASTASVGTITSSVKTQAPDHTNQNQGLQRETSIRSGTSHHSSTVSDTTPPIPSTRPRLVPFTSATRVPVPSLPPSTAQVGVVVGPQVANVAQRIVSQTVKIYNKPNSSAPEVRMSGVGSSDELTMGLHYVQTFGADSKQKTVNKSPSTPTVSTHIRSSFSSLESSHRGDGKSDAAMRTIVRVGEKFKYRVPVSVPSGFAPGQGASGSAGPSTSQAKSLEVRLISGNPIPDFLHVDLNVAKYKGAAVFYGTPEVGDMGIIEVGLYTREGVCVARVLMEVVGRS